LSNNLYLKAAQQVELHLFIFTEVVVPILVFYRTFTEQYRTWSFFTFLSSGSAALPSSSWEQVCNRYPQCPTLPISRITHLTNYTTSKSNSSIILSTQQTLLKPSLSTQRC
jgi:hypothetical protein